ncbi:hypothetical protein [Gracilibacillus phocaeensis]|uniref:hypothetical protein n=1 Tax=Gracilibacillus phocaeensis TaxID=2042304 RepID=UPI0010315D44|nr:hypothetical protein [Gracilibacillus phocaeensis]
MYNNEYPIINFSQRDQDNAKVPGGGNKKKPSFTLSGEDLVEHGKFLLNQLGTLKKNWNDEVINEAPRILQVSYIDKAKAKSHQEKIINMFNNYTHSTQIGMSMSDDIVVQINSLDQMDEAVKNFSSFSENDIPISGIEDIKRYEPTLIKSDSNTYNVTFWDFLDENVNMRVRNLIQQKLNEKNIKFKRSSYGKGTQVLEIPKTTVDKLEFIKKLPVKSIESTKETESPSLNLF